MLVPNTDIREWYLYGLYVYSLLFRWYLRSSYELIISSNAEATKA